MSSRNNILAKVKQHQPSWVDLPTITEFETKDKSELIEEFTYRLQTLHVSIYSLADISSIVSIIHENVTSSKRIVTTIPSLSKIAELMDKPEINDHSLENVELAIIPSHFAVAENGAVWITDSLIHTRVLPFIAQQLAVIVKKDTILANMHQAYDRITQTPYDFGVFIAGPSKTADIEQSLVLGAHGPKGMMVFIID